MQIFAIRMKKNIGIKDGNNACGDLRNAGFKIKSFSYVYKVGINLVIILILEKRLFPQYSQNRKRHHHWLMVMKWLNLNDKFLSEIERILSKHI